MLEQCPLLQNRHEPVGLLKLQSLPVTHVEFGSQVPKCGAIRSSSLSEVMGSVVGDEPAQAQTNEAMQAMMVFMVLSYTTDREILLAVGHQKRSRT